MNFDWNDAQLALKKRFGALAAETVAPRAIEMSRQNSFDAESWQQFCEAGLWELILPAAFSGTEPDWWGFTAALEGIAEFCKDGGFLLSLISQAGFIRGLGRVGSPEQQARYFPRIQAGALTATCIAERHSGTDTGNLQTKATGPHAEKGPWSLNGDKWNIAHAPSAEIFVVVGRIPALAPRDITLFLLDERHGPHIERAARDEKLGNRSIPTGGLTFRDVPVDEEQIFGQAGKGIRALLEMVVIDRIYYGWMGSRLLLPLLDQATAFIAQRQSFKRPLSEHQYVQEKIVDTLMGLAQSRFVGMGALAQLLAGNPSSTLNASVTKLTGSQALLDASRELMALLGSDGYHLGEATHLVQDALGFMSVGGTREMHRIAIFNQYFRQWKKQNPDLV